MASPAEDLMHTSNPTDRATQFNKLSAAIHRALRDVGMKNAHSIPSSCVPIDIALHHLFVSSEGRAYFNKRYNDDRDSIISGFSLEEICESTQPGNTSVVAHGDIFSLTLTKNQPSRRLDTTAFKSELRKLGVSQDVIDAAEESASMLTRAPRRFSVGLNL